MALKNCRQCGKMFDARTSQICNKCIEKNEADLAKVTEYIRENPDSNIVDVSKATEVDDKTILKWIQEGKLLANRAIKYECKRCNKEINSGVLCTECLELLRREVDDAYNKSNKERYYLSKD